MQRYIEVAPFEIDVTPTKNSKIEYGTVCSIEDSLSGRGIVLLGDSLPIVLFAIDWFGNFNRGYEIWREKLASAANTIPQRVAVHSIHQHETPGFDAGASSTLFFHGINEDTIDWSFSHQVIERATQALKDAFSDPTPISHIGIGEANVEKVASNRHLLGSDGEHCYTRYSLEQNPEARRVPEGLIDSTLRMVSFWNGVEPVAVLSYYATHPQTRPGDGIVTADFVGEARNTFETDIGAPVIHFTGAAGNITTGKYNDGSKNARSTLTNRLHRGMSDAWESTTRTSVSAQEVTWKASSVQLPVAGWLKEEKQCLISALSAKGNPNFLPYSDMLHWRDIPQLPRIVISKFGNSLPLKRTFEYPSQTTVKTRLKYPHISQIARDLVWLYRCEINDTVPVSCLQLPRIDIIHTPGELFVEYQLAINERSADKPIAVAAYGDSAPFYIGTREAYSKGGYELGGIHSKVSPDVEGILFNTMVDLLTESTEISTVTPSELTNTMKPHFSGIGELND